MKQCPKCGNSYTDDTLSFCLADGSALTVADEQPTVMRGGGDPNKTEQLPSGATTPAHEAMRVTIPTAEAAPYQTTAAPPQKSRSALWIVLIAAVLLGGLAVIAAAGVLGFIYYTNSGGKNIVIPTTPSPTPWNSPSASPNEDRSRLEDEVAKLKKKLEDAANSNSDTEITIDEDDFGNMGKTANVNSPGDGFLALRNLPSVDIGQRIAKIPHGAKVNIILCSEQSTTIAGRSGHWCMVTYNGQTGWVFDVWLTFDQKN